MKTLYLCGVGNGEGIRLALTVNRAQRRWDRIALLDDDPARHGSVRLGLTIEGGFDRLALASPAEAQAVNLVTRTTDGRARARERIAAFGVPLVSLIHPQVDVFGAVLASEVTVYSNASIGAECSVGESSVVLIGAVVGHGVQVGAGCVIAPNAVVNARVRLGERVYLGSNASVLPDLTIGAGATVAANTLVLADVPPGATVIGVPGSIIELPAHDARPALTAPATVALASGQATEMPASAPEAELVQSLARLFGDVLRLPKVDLHGNLFDLGCTSLIALQLCARIEHEMGVKLRIVDLFRYPTVHGIACLLSVGASGAEGVTPAQQRAQLRRQARARA